VDSEYQTSQQGPTAGREEELEQLKYKKAVDHMEQNVTQMIGEGGRFPGGGIDPHADERNGPIIAGQLTGALKTGGKGHQGQGRNSLILNRHSRVSDNRLIVPDQFVTQCAGKHEES